MQRSQGSNGFWSPTTSGHQPFSLNNMSSVYSSRADTDYIRRTGKHPKDFEFSAPQSPVCTLNLQVSTIRTFTGDDGESHPNELVISTSKIRRYYKVGSYVLIRIIQAQDSFFASTTTTGTATTLIHYVYSRRLFRVLQFCPSVSRRFYVI